jgi:site-specific recombinase XerD
MLMSSIHSFYRWLIQEEYTQINPINLVQRPKREKRLSVIPSEEEYERLLEYLQEQPIRNLVAVRLMGEAGLRISEVVNLKQSCLFQQQSGHKNYHLIAVIGKGNQERQVPLFPDLVHLIQQLISNAQQASRNEFLFLSKQGIRMGDRGLRALLKRCFKNAGIVHYSPHKLRHRAGTTLYQQLKDPFAVARVLGHKNIQTTQIYVQLYHDDLAQRMGILGETEA